MPEDTIMVENATQGEPAEKDVPCGVYERIEQRYNRIKMLVRERSIYGTWRFFIL